MLNNALERTVIAWQECAAGAWSDFAPAAPGSVFPRPAQCGRCDDLESQLSLYLMAAIGKRKGPLGVEPGASIVGTDGHPGPRPRLSR